jgi:hypothetical protein
LHVRMTAGHYTLRVSCAACWRHNGMPHELCGQTYVPVVLAVEVCHCCPHINASRCGGGQQRLEIACGARRTARHTTPSTPCAALQSLPWKPLWSDLAYSMALQLAQHAHSPAQLHDTPQQADTPILTANSQAA